MRVSGFYRRCSRLLLAGLFFAAPASAGEIAGNTADGDELPDGFLEFLGMMVEQDGELIDPLSLSGPMRGDDSGTDEQMVESQASGRGDDASAAEEYPDEE